MHRLFTIHVKMVIRQWLPCCRLFMEVSTRNVPLNVRKCRNSRLNPPIHYNSQDNMQCGTIVSRVQELRPMWDEVVLSGTSVL